MTLPQTVPQKSLCSKNWVLEMAVSQTVPHKSLCNKHWALEVARKQVDKFPYPPHLISEQHKVIIDKVDWRLKAQHIALGIKRSMRRGNAEGTPPSPKVHAASFDFKSS